MRHSQAYTRSKYAQLNKSRLALANELVEVVRGKLEDIRREHGADGQRRGEEGGELHTAVVARRWWWEERGKCVRMWRLLRAFVTTETESLRKCDVEALGPLM